MTSRPCCSRAASTNGHASGPPAHLETVSGRAPSTRPAGSASTRVASLGTHLVSRIQSCGAAKVGTVTTAEPTPRAPAGAGFSASDRTFVLAPKALLQRTTWTAACDRRPSSSCPRRMRARGAAGPGRGPRARRLVPAGRELRLAGAVPRDLRPHWSPSCSRPRTSRGWRASAPSTWPPTASCTPRFGRARAAPRRGPDPGRGGGGRPGGLRGGDGGRRRCGHPDPCRHPAHRHAGTPRSREIAELAGAAPRARR